MFLRNGRGWDVSYKIIHLLGNSPLLHSPLGQHFQRPWKLARNDVPRASTMVLHIPDTLLFEPSESAAGGPPRETPTGREVRANL